MTLNGVMAVILHYFTEFGKHAFQHITTILVNKDDHNRVLSVAEFMHESIVFCSTCTMSS